jgi:tetratricopeptide (TPR) repeat protein
MLLDGLTSLVDKSLVQYQESGEGAPRFEMLTTVREYALEQLTRSGEAAAIQRRHASYYLTLAEAGEPHFTTTEQTVWLARLEQELGNLRAALAWSLAAGGAAEIGVRIASALWWFWRLRGHLREGQAWVERCLAACSVVTPVVQANALNILGDAARAQRNYGQAGTLLAESLALYQALGHQSGIAEVLRSLGYLAQWEGQYARARHFFQESLILFRAAGREGDVAWVLNTLGETARCQRDYRAARVFYDESLPLHQHSGNQRGAAVVLHNLGYVALAQREWQDAIVSFRTSLTLFQALSDQEGTAWCLVGLAGVATAQGHPQRGARLLGAAEGLLSGMAVNLAPADQLEQARMIVALRAQLDEATFGTAWSEGRALSLDEAITYALEDLPA